ncbi:MAG TPA: glycosyltransferase N-terminal domain-containing protein, partial [Prolixibacteraceae bacterium]|nr:glycosyltransferase N-terminal domain-containing protein [Prolixibacteraceae bacterium]
MWIKGRKGLFAALRKHILPSDEVVWVHCASLGEFEQGRPLITEIKNRYPNKKIVLTFFSPSGYEVQKNFA